MPSPHKTLDKTLVELETRFWQSIVDHDTEIAVSLLDEPALMVSAHGAMKFDHAGYRKMADHGTMVLKSFELGDVDVLHPNETTAILTYRVKQDVSDRGKPADTATTTTEMIDTSTWIQIDGEWRCVMHTEAPAGTGH
jgi:hypothetical protein